MKKETNTLDQITYPSRDWSDIEHWLESKTTQSRTVFFYDITLIF